jgi:hypothetical protein
MPSAANCRGWGKADADADIDVGVEAENGDGDGDGDDAVVAAQLILCSSGRSPSHVDS